MEIETDAVYFKQTNYYRGFDHVWGIATAELNGQGASSLEALRNPTNALHEGTDTTSWLQQAILEFQDLQHINFPDAGHFGSTNYLYYEAINTLRESVLAGLSGLYHSSFSVLRSSLEMFVFHSWWQLRLERESTHEKYFAWLDGRGHAPPFRNVLEEVIARIDGTSIGGHAKGIYPLYQCLCCYAHKPLLAESISRLRGTNKAIASEAALAYWIKIIGEVSLAVVHLLVLCNPVCVFVAPVITKFGFNPPVGWLFDESNVRVLERAIGKRMIETFRFAFQANENVKALREWVNERPDLTNEEILKTWDRNKDVPNDAHCRTEEERLLLRLSIMKADLRAMNWMFAYQAPFGILQEFDKPTAFGDDV
ncbi:MAG TPA: hypothetical protein VJZ71_13220 [Phycisphaerae bacterium]|nr:hypothetical protein [Phycisphaerae bacterium]